MLSIKSLASCLMTVGKRAWNSAQMFDGVNWLQHDRIWLMLKLLNDAFLALSPSITVMTTTSLDCRSLMMTPCLMMRRWPCTRLSASTRMLHCVTSVSAVSSLGLLLLEAWHHHMACALASTPPPSMVASLNPCPWVVFLLPAPVAPCSLKCLLVLLEPAPLMMSSCSLWWSGQTSSCSEALPHCLDWLNQTVPLFLGNDDWWWLMMINKFWVL